jgi:hypothetical protein
MDHVTRGIENKGEPGGTVVELLIADGQVAIACPRDCDGRRVPSHAQKQVFDDTGK